MPEAAIDVDGKPVLRKQEVRAPAEQRRWTQLHLEWDAAELQLGP